MTAYEMSEYKIKILKTNSYLKQEVNGNNTETVLLTNDEVTDIMETLNVCMDVLDDALKSKG